METPENDWNRRRFLKSATLGTAAIALGTRSAEVDAAPAAQLSQPPRNAQFPLVGTWSFRPDPEGVGEASGWATVRAEPGSDHWRQVELPGCWERDDQSGSFTGQGWYRKNVPLPPHLRAPGLRLWWECDAVSYHAVGYVGGSKVGEHTGLWDAFAWELSLASSQGFLTLALVVEKAGGNRFPLRETLTGFLPYVWGTWGGPWQGMRLRATGPCRIRSLFAPGSAEGEVVAEADVDLLAGSNEAILVFTLQNRKGEIVARQEAKAPSTGTVASTLKIGQPERWSPHSPILYTLTVTAYVDGRLSDLGTRRVGFREVTTRGEKLLLNGTPIFFRGPLSWGWYEETRAPNPAKGAFERELARVKALGFNGVKLSRWIPPASYFEIADRLGILLWLEMPVWLPENSSFARQQTPLEYDRILRQVSDHPSVILYTAGAGQGMDTALLGDLYVRVKKAARGALVRALPTTGDGPLASSAPYADVHLRSELSQVSGNLEAAAPRWRQPQPLLLGEYGDQDAFRDLSGLIEKRSGRIPWWATTEQIRQTNQAELTARASELRASSWRQALLTRKILLERARSNPQVSGYVIDSLYDTPISTTGLFDDSGQLRFTESEFAAVNGDTTLFLQAPQGREWTAGGERPYWPDTWGAWSGETVYRVLGVSHYGRATVSGRLSWTAAQEGGSPVARGDREMPALAPGHVEEAGRIEFVAPNVSRPQKLVFSASLIFEDGTRTANSWPLWVYPRLARAGGSRVGLFDPAEHLVGFAEAVGIMPVLLSASTGEPLAAGGKLPLTVATTWRPAMLEYVRAGGRLLLIQPGPSREAVGEGLPSAPLPFWREAMRLFENHPSWGDFPHQKNTDLNFYGLASDTAFEPEKVAALLGPDIALTPVLTRVDARTFEQRAYILWARVGAGTILMTTLRPQGGIGDQPSGLPRHVAGAYLLRTWLDWLSTA